MTYILVLFPTLIALSMFNKGEPAYRIAQRVYLPSVLLMPMYVDFRVGGFSIVATSILSLVLAAAAWLSSSRRLNVVDVCVILLGLNTFYSDLQHHAFNDSFYAFYFTVTKWVCPYFIGRFLIEQNGMRRPFARTFALCVAFVAITCFYEYKGGYNLWTTFLQKITHVIVTGQGGQFRWGFARVDGPWSHAIIAGLIFSVGLFMQMWLVATKTDFGSSRRLRFLRHRRAPLYLTLVICMGIFMSGSRGPWLGCGFGLIVAATAFAKDRKRAAIVCVTTLLIAGTIASTVIDKYTAIDASKTTDRDQLNAAYRRDLLTTYAPVIAEGGLFGWGSPRFLKNGYFGYIDRQPSIDNEYLRLTVALGYVGITLFLLTLLLCHLRLVKLCATLRAREDYLFAYCLLGALIAASFTISTVALLDPMMQILFLLLGWSQSVRPTKDVAAQSAAVRVQQFEFERVFV